MAIAESYTWMNLSFLACHELWIAAKFENFLPNTKVKPWKFDFRRKKDNFLCIFKAISVLLWKNSKSFCQNIKVKSWKFKKSADFLLEINFRFRFTHFSLFRPHFHQLFAKIMRWSLRNLEKKAYFRWKINFWFLFFLF